jgi:hypothetical protein
MSMSSRAISRSIGVAIAICAAGAVGFFLATAVFGGGSSGTLRFPRPLEPGAPQHVKLSPGDDGFDTFARDFDEFPIYWLGPEFGGHSLRYVIRHVSSPEASPSENIVSFLYGTCEMPAEGGCPPPVQVITEPYCLVPPSLISQAPGGSALSHLRGNATSMEVGGGLRIWAGDASVKLYASDRQLLNEAAASIRSPNGLGPAGVGDDLPAPHTDCSDYEMVAEP